jgi:alanine-glyoxylate transaminase/serine-glyoxylate transaminase/serine-pyruvate transaminase
MGAVSPGDILATVGAIEKALAAFGYELELGEGLSAAQRMLVGLG